MENWFLIMAVVLALATIGGVAAKWARQPPLLGYIAAGIVFNLLGMGRLEGMKIFLDSLGQVGITLLLFLAGLELPLPELKKMGKVAMGVGITQICISSILGFGLARGLGFGVETAIYLGIGMAFGSTILVVKLLSEKGELQSLHGRVATGYLLVQDFVAIGLLLVNGKSGGDAFMWTGYLGVVVKAAAMVGISVWLSERVMGKVMNQIGKSTELVFISALGWCFLCAALISLPVIGFSREIGGFLAGLALAGALEQAQIVSRVRPLRDFFLTWFFVSLGANLTIGVIKDVWWIVIAISAFVMIVNPLIVMALLGMMGYKKRTAFMSGLAISQLSEFSLILVATAGGGERAVMSVTLAVMLTMTISTYLIWHATKIYKWLAPYLKILEKGKPVEPKEANQLTNHAILVGHNRTGSMVSPVLEKLGITTLIVDFNPQVIEKLIGDGKKAIYGDISDHELYEKLAMDKAKIIISTISDYSDNRELLGEVRMKPKRRPYIVMTASNQDDATALYRAGADFVLVPHSVGGEYLADYLKHHWHA